MNGWIFKMKKAMAVAAVLTMSAGLVACGSKNADIAEDEQIHGYGNEASYNYDPDTNSLTAQRKSNSSYLAGEEVAEEAKADVEDESYATADRQGGSGDSENTTTTLETINTEKLVYRCDLSFESLNYDESVEKIRSLIREYGGFVENEDVNQSSAGRNGEKLYTYSATIRVPSSNYESFLAGTGDVGELKNKSQNVDNMTKVYTNLKAEMEVLETKRQSYLEMMKEAKTLNDMDTLLMIDERLTQVEISINQLKTQMNQIDNDVAYSYISISIREVKEYEEAPAESFGEEVGQSLRNGWDNFVDWLRDMVVYITGHLPQIFISIVIILLVWFLVIRRLLRKLGVPNRKERKARRAARRAAKRAEKQAAKQAENTQGVQNMAPQSTEQQMVQGMQGVPQMQNVQGAQNVGQQEMMQGMTQGMPGTAPQGMMQGEQDTAPQRQDVQNAAPQGMMQGEQDTAPQRQDVQNAAPQEMMQGTTPEDDRDPEAPQ